MEFPDVLDISDFIDKECLDNTNYLYDLYGIINHVDNFDFGHYYTYIKYKKINNNNIFWYEYDDTNVKEIGLTINNLNSYRLFYIKKN